MNRRLTLKTVLIALCAAVVALLATLFLCSCDGSFDDKSYIDDDYIEVTSLRINGSANISMSSNGDPSSYQLDIRTVPADATNKKLSYYIPSDYHQYVTVSENGLLSAHSVSGDVTVPVTVRSTTNPKAQISVSVKVEDVAVERVKFAQESIPLLYNGDPGQITVVYEPSHAIDGRNAVYTSLNENICTVTNAGVVTPVGVGVTRVKVTCTTRSGKAVENFIPIEVSYATGQYQLDVSGSPDFNQVIGNFSSIDFTLLILGDNVDPNPSISWYVDTERVSSNQDKTQYTHTPSATTQITYYIYVYITPYQGSTVTLRSDPITVYRAFNGITLSYDNVSSVYTGYRYGDVATFDIGAGDTSSTVTHYSWTLSETGNSNRSEVIAVTYPSDKNLTRRINVSGDYSLTATWLDANENTVSRTMFAFSSERLIDGDVLVVRPSPSEYGLPPDSYHWYVVPCDENGSYNENEKRLYADTASGEALYYPLTEGNFRFLVTASIGGVAATIAGETEPYTLVSDVIRVYGATEPDEPRDNDLIDVNNPSQKAFAVKNYSAIESVSIEGIGRDSYSVYLKWNDVDGSSSYIVELTLEDGSVILLDSAKNDGNDFGSNFAIISQSVVTLKDIFSVRIKQKSGLYSRTYHYGIPNDRGTGDETHILTYSESLYEYFSTIGLNNSYREYSAAEAAVMNVPALNGYIYDMSDMRDLIGFILLARPSVNTYIDRTQVYIENVLYDEYSLNVYIPFTLTDAEKAAFPHGLTEEELASFGAFSNLAEIVFGAAASLPYAFDFTLRFADEEPGVKAIFDVPSSSGAIKTTDTPKGRPSSSENYVIDRSETVDASSLPIDRKTSVYVRSSDELVFVAELGYNPVPALNDALSTLYKKIKETVVRITDPRWSDAEKIRAYYDYLALNTTLESKLAEMEEDASSAHELYLYAAYRLEGVFNGNQTVADVGVAKAFTVMCRISGIPCLTVTADINGKLRTLNKVYVDGSWFVVDVAAGMYVVDGYSVVSGDAFMLSESAYSERYAGGKAVFYGDFPVALGSRENEVREISSQSDLVNAINELASLNAGTYGVEIDFARNAFVDENSILDALGAVENRSVILGSEITVVSVSNEKFRVIILATVRAE